MFASILILLFLPWLDTSPVCSARFRPIYKQVFWLLVVDCVLLGVVGANSPNEPVFEGYEGFRYVELGQITTAYFFLHFLVVMPVLGRFEKCRPVPESISEPVLKGGTAAAPQAAREKA
jgi:ubiquinol-cytochrome c reductase cytochrome b subunit